MAGDANNKTSYEDKLAEINKELLILEDCCIKRGLTPLEIEKSASIFLRDVKHTERSRSKRTLLVFAVLACVFAALLNYDPAYRWMLSVGRASSIKILKVWDWTNLYQTECLLKNPLLLDEDVIAGTEDCPMCSDIHKVHAYKNISMEILAESYIMKDIPVIVADGTRDWTNKDQFNIKFLDRLYNENKVLQMYMACSYNGNIKIDHGNHRHFLRQAGAGEIDNFYARWQNCFKSTAKPLREVFKRPYCLPPMIELVDSSWMIVSHNYHPEKNPYIRMPSDESLLMMIQISGEITVKLKPKSVCSDICKTMRVTLQPGYVLFTTDFLYDVEYKPSSKPDSITFAVPGALD